MKRSIRKILAWLSAIPLVAMPFLFGPKEWLFFGALVLFMGIAFGLVLFLCWLTED